MGELEKQKSVLEELARSLNPFMDGRDPRTLETTGKLQILQQVGVPSFEKWNINPANEGSTMNVGITPQASDTIGDDKN